MSDNKVEVLIVGAGAAGAILASRLTAANKKVVILELGPNWSTSDLVSSQIWSRRIKWGAAPVESKGANPVGYNPNLGWGSGGSAIHHFAMWPRMHVEDFRTHTLFGRGVDWPISYEDLRPYYDRVQKDVGVSGDHAQELWRPAGEPYPLPPLKLFRQAEVLAAGFQKIGIRSAPMPLAILSQDYQGRPACLNDGWCDAGCPIGSLANPLISDLPSALARGAELRSRATVTRVLMNKSGQRAEAVEYIDSTGQRQTQHADVIVLANNCIQGARVLLNSASPQHPDGLGNSSGTVGRYVMTHFTANMSGMFDEDLQNHMGTIGSAKISQESYGKPEGSYTWYISMAHKLTDLIGIANTDSSLIGTALHQFMQRAAKGLGSIYAIAEQTPRAENGVVLSHTKDSFGLPLASWHNAIDEREKKLFTRMRDEGIKALNAAGATQIWAPERVLFQHVVGGLRMGANVKNSVCDSYGRCHDVPNLLVAGGGLFPTEGAVNPTFTVHVLTQRTADHLLAHWGSYLA